MFDACVLVRRAARCASRSPIPPIVANLPEGHGLDPGDAVRVRLAQVDVEEGRLHFQPA